MKCEICGARIDTIMTRHDHVGNQINRLKKCRKCNINYYTIEYIHHWKRNESVKRRGTHGKEEARIESNI